VMSQLQQRLRQRRAEVPLRDGSVQFERIV
jgi:hypothetical protein